MKILRVPGIATFLIASTLGTAAPAAVLRVANGESDQRIRVFDGDTASSASAGGDDIGIQVGSVTADIAGHRVFFIGNAGAAQALYELRYATTQTAMPQALPGALRITHLEWDASTTPRLVGVAIDTVTDNARLVTVSGTTVADLGMPAADCCVFRAGVSAFRAADDSLYLVGRRDTDVVDQIFRFGLTPPALVEAAAVPADLSILELAIDASGQLIGLAYSATADVTKAFTTNAALTIDMLGSGLEDCCFANAGMVALDAAAHRLHVLGPGIAGVRPNPSWAWSFDLDAGTIDGGFLARSGAGLFVDATPIVPDSVLLADGFE